MLDVGGRQSAAASSESDVASPKVAGREIRSMAKRQPQFFTDKHFHTNHRSSSHPSSILARRGSCPYPAGEFGRAIFPVTFDRVRGIFALISPEQSTSVCDWKIPTGNFPEGVRAIRVRVIRVRAIRMRL